MFNLPEDNWNLRLLKSPQPALSAVRQQAIEYFKKELSNGALKTEPLHKCPCGCSDFVHISSQDRFGLSFSTHLCRSCGLLCTTILFYLMRASRIITENITILFSVDIKMPRITLPSGLAMVQKSFRACHR